MSSSKRMNLICVIAIVLSVLASVFLPVGGAENGRVMGYEDRLFDTARVHTLDISMDGWEEFIETCQNEEYSACDVIIDGEIFKNVAIRAKGNTSLSNVSSMNSDRYSFKVEFDHFDSAFSYHGLDKLSLNNLIQDNTFMKDYLTYRMMNEFDVPAPLASFVYITVNGGDWGLYLAVEGVEDAFLMRNWGVNHGKLYKPDSMDMGGGRGNGKGFDMEDFENLSGAQSINPMGVMPGGFDRTGAVGGFGAKGSNDVKLVYSGDDFENYSNIFANAKTDITDADKQRLIDAIKRMNEGDTAAVDIEDVIRYFVVHNFVVNDDSYTGTMIHNYYLYEENGILSMIPWDYNLAFGTFQGGNASSSVNKDIDQPVSGGMDDRPMVNWIFESEEHTQKYHAYFAEFLSNVDALKIIEDAENLIAPYVEKDPTKFCTEEAFEKGVNALKTFVTLRTQSVQNQLNGTDELVDVTGFSASDMGTMGAGRGGNTEGRTKQRTGDEAITPQTPAAAQDNTSSAPEKPENTMQMPEMPTGGMGSMPTDDQMPIGGTSDIPTDGQMPIGGMSWRPSGDFSAPPMPFDEGMLPESTEMTQITEPAAEAPEDIETQSTDAQTGDAQASGESDRTGRDRENQFQWNMGANRMNGFEFMNQAGADTGAQAGDSPRMLLIISIIVLLLSIVIAFIIKH